MGKPQYQQKFRSSWLTLEKFKKWLEPVGEDVTKAFCNYCKCQFNARLADIEKHMRREKHVRSSHAFDPQRQRKIAVVDVSKELDKKKIAEASLAMFSATHSNMNSIDHLSDLCASNFSDSDAAKMKMHRTKCTGLIKNVLSPHFRKELRDDIGDKDFSLLLDESTDVSVTKLLGIVIRYYSGKYGKIVSTFLCLVELSSGTAEGILEGIEHAMLTFNLDLRKLLGIGTDNASVMVGVNNGLFALLKRKYDLPHLVLIRCVCHSLQLAVSHATTETLPRNLDFLIRETYNWFSHSSIRQMAYKQIFEIINEGVAPLKILQMSGTRWISIEPAIERILNQWDELKVHFEQVKRTESCYLAEMLYSNYRDATNRVYLTYIQSILIDVQRTNKAFESGSADPAKLLDDLRHLLHSVGSKILIPTARIDILKDSITSNIDPNPYLGYAFEKAISELDCCPEMKKMVKDRCVSFTVKLCTELKNRLPTNLVLLESMKLLHPTESLKHRVNKLPIVKLVTQFETDPRKIDQIQNQWINLTNVEWIDVSTSEKLWNEVGKHRDSCGENPYQELANFALRLLSLPYSNADIERVFSQLNIVKTKLRNKLKTEMTNAILDVRYGLKRSGKCCFNYQLPKEVVAKIGTLEAYGKTDNKSSADKSEDLISANANADSVFCDAMADILSHEI